MNSSIMRSPCVRIGVLFLLSVLALGGCSNGGSAVPAAALSIVFDAASDHPENVINDAIKTRVKVTVNLPSDSNDSDTITVTLSDSTGTEAAVQGQGNGVTGGGQIEVLIDGSTLADGPIDVTVQSSSGAESTFTAAFMKDTVPPELPTTVTPLDTNGAATQWVNIATASATDVTATFANAGTGQDSVTLDIIAAGNHLTQAPQTFTTTTIDYADLDLTSVADGPFDISVTVTDPAMNSASMHVRYDKDTVAPQGAVASQVWPGPSNPADTINIASAGAVSVLVGLGVDSEARTATASLSDSSTTVASAPANVPMGGGFQWIDGTDATTLVDGPITLVITVADAAGNTTTFTGTPATKDTVAPSGPVGANVAAGGANPASVINLVSSNAVGVAMTWPAASSASDSARVTLSRGSVVESSSFAPPSGGGSSSVSGLDATSLSDGSVAVAVVVTDPAGNVTTMAGTLALKDTIPPSAPGVARVAAGPSNNQDIVNIASVGTVSGVANFPPAGAGETFVMTMSDGAISVSSGATGVPVGGGSVSVGPMNLSAMSDGFVSVNVTVTDPAQNQTSMSGTVATKDTIAPTGATAASVSAGPGNGANVINLNSVGAVTLSVTWPAGAPGTETAFVQMVGGTTVSAPVTQIGGGGTTSVSGVNANPLTDGSVALSVVTVDGAGNTTSFSGTSALKDTVGPIGATAVNVPGGPSNPANWVNSATANSATVQATMPAGASASDMISVSCTDGSTTVSSASQPCPPAGGVMTFTMNLGSMSDGALSLTATVVDTSGNPTTSSGAASKDVVSPVNPQAANVASGPQNPVDTINSFTVTGSNVMVSWPGEAGNESMYVVLSDGVSSQASPPTTLAASAAQVAFNALNCSPLADGTITVTVMVTDAAGNTTAYGGTQAVKDTQPPSAPSSAHVAVTPNNPVDWINVASAGSVSCDVSFASGNPLDVATVTLSDGVSGVSTPLQNVVASGTVTWSGINASFLSDGPVAVSVNVIDVAGNVTSFSGTSATKDTIAPTAATAVSIPAGAGHALGWVSIANVSSVTVDSTIPGQGAGMTAVCTMTDGPTTVTSGVMPVPPAGGLVSFSGMNCSGLADGAVSVTVTVSDPAGNPAAMTVAGTKDTVAPTVVVDPTTSPTSAVGQAVTGQSEAGASVSVSGGASVATGTANSSGRFSIAVTLNAGVTNTLAVATTDAAGNTGAGATTDFTSAALTIAQNPAAPPVTFTDVSAASGLDDSGSNGGGCFQDFDGDGDLDFFMGGANKLWQNDGMGVFTDMTALNPALNGGTSASVADYDNDGDLDLLLVDGSNATLMRNEWIPLGLFKFTDVTVVSGMGVSGSLTSGLWLDISGDGWVDCVVVDGTNGPQARNNLGTGMFSSPGIFGAASTQMFYGVTADLGGGPLSDLAFGDVPGALFRNDGGSVFTEVAASSNLSIKQSAAGGLIVADVDNDGDLDLIVSGGDVTGDNQLYLNDGSGSFTSMVAGSPVANLAGIATADGWVDVAAGDVNNDGRVDLWVGRNGANRLFLSVGDTNADGVWEYVEVAAACGVAGSGDTRLVHLADLDGDGDLDLYAGDEGSSDQVWRNEVNNHRNLTVKVNGLGSGAGTSSKDAVGARVELWDETETVMIASREISGGRGHGSQDPLRAHFGVTPSQIYTVHVRFPSGAVRTMKNVVPRDAAGQTVTVNE